MDRPDVFMPLYIGDYLAGTSRLTTELHGAYLLLIMDYWMNGKLPDNNQALASIARMNIDAWSIARASIEHYFSIENGVWVHKRIEQELIIASEKKVKSREKAEKAASARWGKGKNNASSNATSTSQAMHEECPSPSPSDISITKVIESIPKKLKFDPSSLTQFMPNDLGQQWIKWIAYRRERKLSTKESTWKAQAENLSEWGKQGHNPCEIIKASISNGWQGLFEPKQTFVGGNYAANQQHNGFGASKEKASPADRIRAQARVAIERIDAEDDGPNLYADGGFIPEQSH